MRSMTSWAKDLERPRGVVAYGAKVQVPSAMVGRRWGGGAGNGSSVLILNERSIIQATRHGVDDHVTKISVVTSAAYTRKMNAS